MKPAFSFQVTSSGVMISFDPGVDFERIKNDLRKHVSESSDFFAGIDIFINMGEIQFELDQLSEIMDIVKKYRKVNNIYFSQQDLNKKKKKESFNKDTVLIKRTIRSGQQVKYPTNIVVLGDVNPGSELIAAGDVIVLGKLRGVVHAGAGGYSRAEIVALSLQPTQLRIANLISRPPEQETNSASFAPERAFIKNDSIMVEKLKN